MTYNTKTKHKAKSKKSSILALILIFLVVCAALFGIFVLLPDTQAEPETKTKDPETSEEQPIIQEVATAETTNTAKSPDKQTDGGEDPNTSETLYGNITTTRLENGKLTIYTSIAQYLGSGSCKATLTGPSGKVVTITSEIIASPSSSSCGSLSADLSQFDESGTWNIKINLSANDKIGTITGEVEI